MRKMRKSLSLLLAMLMLTSMMPIGTVSLFDVPAVKAEAAETTIAPPDGDTTEDTESTYTWAFDASTGTLTIGGTGVVNVELAKELESEESGNETDTDTGTGTDAETTEVPDIASMLPWGENIKDIKHVVVEEGITGLGDGSLSYLINMESISLPSTLVTVGKGAFCYALSLKKLIIPEGVTSIDEGAFSTLTSLETLILPDSLQVCKDDFSEICSYSLTNVTLPACIESFDSSYSMYIENLYNKSLTVAVDFSVFDEGYEIIFTEEYRYFLQLYNELLLKKSVEEGLFGTVADENALQQEFISKFNARFGTSYTIDSMNDLFDDPDSLTPLTINRTIYCYENSAQHTVCTKHYDKHILYGTDTEHTSCFTLSGTSTDDNSNSFTWTVDITARTLTINGTGEMEFASYSNLPGWYNVSKFYDTVNIGEGITSFEGEYVFSSIENLNLPATYTNTSIAESIFYCKKVKNVNVAEGNTTILSIDGVVYVQLSEEELAEFKSEYGTDSTGDLFLVYYPSGRSYFSISDRTFSVLFLGCYNYLNEITIPDTVAYLLLSLYSNSLKKVNIPSSVKALVVETSELASSLEEINVDSDNTVYASKDGILFSKDFSTLYVYPAAKDLSELVLPESVTKIARDAINNYRGYSFLSDVKILNKECVIESNAILEDITIHGIPESTAQTYATENGNKFVSIEEKEIAGVAVKTMPNITEFMQGKSFVSDGLTLTVTYTDGTTSDRTAGFTVSGFDSSKLGICTLTVDYSGYATCTFDVTIIEYVEPVLTEGTQLTVYVDGDGVEYVKFVPAKTAEYKFTYSSTADGNYSVSLYNANKEYYDYLGSSVSLTADTTYYVYLHNYNNSAIPFTLSVAESHYHSYTKTLTKEATCAEAGLYTYTCSCGESYTEEIALLPHADDNEDFVCDTCDAEIKILYEGTCGDTMTWKIYSSGLMLIEGSGEMTSYPWSSYRNKITKVRMADEITSITSNAFYNCTNLVDVKLPSGLVSIDSYAFERCLNLKSIELPAGVTSIGYGAFSRCSSLSAINLPSSVTSIGETAFGDCTSLTAINVDSENTAYSSNNGVLYNKEGTVLVQCPGALTTVEILTTTKEIGSYAFSDGKITAVTLPELVTNIDSNAFAYCSDLTSVVLSDNLTTIGDDAFRDCEALTKITIPESVTDIGERAFYSCGKLDDFNIPSSIRYIDENAFSGTAFYYNSNNWDNGALYSDCCLIATNSSLPTDYTIKENTLFICKGALSGQSEIENLTIPFVGSRAVTEADEYQYPFGYIFGDNYSGSNSDYYQFNQDYDKGNMYSYVPKSLKNVTVTSGVITTGAFDDCESLTISLSDNVTKVCDKAFDCYECTVKFYGRNTEIYGSSTAVDASLIFAYEASTAHVYAETYRVSYKLFDINQKKVVSAKLVNSLPLQKYSSEYALYYDALLLMFEVVFDDSTTSTLSLASLAASHNFDFDIIDLSDNEKILRITNGTITININVEFCEVTEVSELEINSLYTNLYGKYCTFVPEVSGTYYVYSKAYLYTEKVTSDMEEYQIEDKLSPQSYVSYGKEPLYNYFFYSSSDGLSAEYPFHNEFTLEAGHEYGILVFSEQFIISDHELTSENSETKTYNDCYLGTVTETTLEYGYTIKESSSNSGEHVWSDFETLIEPTDNSCGLKKAVCERCGLVGYAVWETSSCSHEWTTTEVISEPTCSTAGEHKSTCLVCGNETTETDYAIGHIAGEVKSYDEPKCTTNGTVVSICQKCGVEYSRDIYSRGHNYSTEWTVDSEATCTTDGSKSHHCTKCNEKSDVTVIPATGHSYGDFVTATEPTCTKTGLKKKTCSACGDVVTETIDALGHDFSTEWTIDKAATCTKDGSKSHHCTRCNEKSDVTVIPALGHDFSTEWTIDKAATCTKDGSKSHHCSRCSGKSDVTVISATGHSYGDFVTVTEPTCTKTGLKKKTCSDCGDVVTETIDALGHDFSTEWTIDNAATCTKDGSKSHHCTKCNEKSDITALAMTGHAYGEFTVTKEPTCTSNGFKKKICANCNDVVTETIDALGHDFSTEWTVDNAATCTKDGSKSHHCSRCSGMSDVTVISATGHSYGDFVTVTEPTCTKTGLKKKTCSDCGDVVTETIDALGHDFSTEWTIDNAATCTKDGSKSHHCTKCNEKSDITALAMTGHAYGEFTVTKEPTCTSNGFKKKICANCNDVVTETIDALGHDFSTEWTVDNAATCTKDGSKSHHCSRCSGMSDVTVISATGHSYGDFVTVTEPTCTKTGLKKKTCSACGDVVTENIDVLTADGHSYSDYTTLTEPTCTLKGLKQKVCSVCGDIVKEEIPALGHDFPEYTRTKEPTVLCEGEEQSTCTRCGHVDTIILPAIQIDIDSNTNYGLANFTVVNAQTKEPIKNAKIYIYTEEDGENEFSTDENGKVSIVLPVGKQQISAYADGCLTRNLKINVKSGINDIPLIGLSNMKTYDAEVTQHPMTKEEIEEAGIDMEDPENNHVFKYELNLVFVPEVDWLSISYYMDDFGNIWPGGGNGSGSGSGGGGYGSGGGWVSSGSGSGKGTYYRYVDSDGGVKEIYPVSEYFYLIISGEVRWLKEMFDVEMLVINNSQTDTLENLNATLNLPEGLSLAAMKGDEQSLSVDLDNVPEGGTSSVHWYVRGDTAGTYPIEATLTGMVMPFEEEISDTFKAEKAIEVWAGNALHLDFEVPGAAYYGEDYNVKITLTNVSDITLYNVSSFVTNIKQSRVTHYSDGSVEEEIYMDKDVNIGDFAAEFKPGDKIVIELSINILFKSKLMEYKLNKLIGYVDGIEKLIKSYKAIKTGLDIGSALIKGIGKVSKALDTFISSAALATDKLNATKALKEAVADFSLKYSKSESKTLDASVKLANSSVGVMFNAFTANPDEWLKNSSVNDIQKLTGGIKTLGNSISSTDSSTKSFNVFDSIRTLISAIPVVFTLQEYFLVEDEDNTTSIPYSVSVLPNTPHYFGVSNLGRHLSNILTVAARDFIKDSLPSYFLLLPGVNNELSTEDEKREIAVVENEIAQFKAKSATGDVKYKAYIVRNEEQSKAKMLRAAANTATNGFELSSDAEDAVIENGVLTFTGDAIINVKPLSTQGGTLVVEADDGTKYEYDLNVIEQHECDEDDYEVIISPTADYDGFAVKCCSVCEDVMDVVILSASDCEHTFGAWTNEITPTCNECGLRSHSCSKCGYEESEILDIDTKAHVVSDWVIDTDSTCSAVGSKHTYCTVCKETMETQEIAKKAHTVSDWVIDTDSTCAAVGSKHTYCTVCKETIETQEIAKKGHTVSDWIVINAPSCTSNGKQIKKCTVCNTEIESKTISATGHTMTAWTTTKAPTCTESGVRTRTCTVCKKTESAGISATGHSDSNNDGTCDNCGADLGTKDPSANCSCKCHKTKGIQKFFWKILNFFNKIFKKNQFCDCGAKHW